MLYKCAYYVFLECVPPLFSPPSSLPPLPLPLCLCCLKVMGQTYVQTGVHALSVGITPIMGIMIEMILTSILVFTIVSSAMDKKSDFKQIASLNIGLTISACIFAG